jgi:hypothetical protein
MADHQRFIVVKAGGRGATSMHQFERDTTVIRKILGQIAVLR